jgi:dienelactone hydrolase
MYCRIVHALLLAAVVLFDGADAAEPSEQGSSAWQKIAPYFAPPKELANDYGDYRSPLKFNDGREVKTPADWKQRRMEILKTWQGLMGAWPKVIEKQELEYLEKVDEPLFVRHKVRFRITPEEKSTGYLLVPKAAGPHPAVLTVYYEPETAVGLSEGKHHRDFALQLAKRGFVCLSMGFGASLYYPSREAASVQPLSANAYTAANGFHVLANLPEVDAKRIGIVGHSYGGKWAMFASCLYDKFACTAWSDGGIVFDESRSNVNYWEPWYLGYEAGKTRARGIPKSGNPRTGAYKRMMEEERDLHELHALMAPRPFLVSGGSEDPPERWKALNHAVAVNRLLGYENRVAMTNRKMHDPTEESNEQIYAFFEHFLKPAGKRSPGEPG